MAHNISVPDIGDFDSVEIIEVLVKVGDQINENDPIVTLESDKSSVEVPSPFSGKILEFKNGVIRFIYVFFHSIPCGFIFLL